MAQIRHFPFVAQLRSDASTHIVRWRGGRIRQSGRGLVFWFGRETASIAEVPMDDRETIFAGGIEQDHIAFDYGRTATIGPAAMSLRLVPG